MNSRIKVLGKISSVSLVLVALLASLGGGAAAQGPLGTAFTYQGQLVTTSGPVNDTCDMQFDLYDVAGGGSPLDSEALSYVRVSDGVFSVQLDFEAAVFDGEARWLEVSVQCSGDSSHVTLEPRYALTAAPYALYALAAPWGGLTDVPGGLSDGDDDTLGALSCGSGQIAQWNGTAWVCSTGGGGGGWSLSGNAGTNPTNFLGTTDIATLTFKVSNTVALRLAPGAAGGTPNVIGGYEGNVIPDSVQGGTIGGGGSSTGSQFNRVTADYATVGGGSTNLATGQYATIGGGDGNWANGWYATVGGGQWNKASGAYSMVPGGYENTAVGGHSFAAGRHAVANQGGCFVWGDGSSEYAPTECNTANAWVIRASGGVTMYTSVGDDPTPKGVFLAANGGAWNTLSDRERKENFQPVDSQALLARLAETPITTWNYKAQDPAIRHIGPMAQDFNLLVEGLGGEGDEYINSLDADGVALTAIQALHAQNVAQQAQIEALSAENAALEARLAALEAKVAGQGGATASSAPASPNALTLLGLLLAAGGVAWVKRGK